jgi:hypothetical protein
MCKFLHALVAFNYFTSIGGKPEFTIRRIALKIQAKKGAKTPRRQIKFEQTSVDAKNKKIIILIFG